MNNKGAHIHELLQKISGGDVASFTVMFERYRHQLFIYLYKITKSAETAEEIVLDVFIKIWNRQETLAEVEDIDAFLYRLAHNRAIDFLRSLQRSPTIQQQVWDALQEPPSNEFADNRLLLKNAEGIIGEAIRRLSPQRQQVFSLHYYRYYSNDEIAQQLHLSKNTVRNHLSAAMEFIRQFITDNISLLILLFLFKA